MITARMQSHYRLFSTAITAALSLLSILGSGVAQAQPGGTGKYEPRGDRVYHGASLPYTWDDSRLRAQLQQYQKASGKSIAVVTWFASLYEMGRMTSWRQNYIPNLRRVKRLHAVSLVKFSVQDYAYDRTRRIAQPGDIAKGVYDEYFNQFADAIRDFKDPVFISINHEMNGNWFPYSQDYPGSQTTASEFVAMWQHIVNVFRRRGANNVAWVWAPNVPDVGRTTYSKYYPGDGYVDWIGISFYSGANVDAISQIYHTYARRKPFFVTEWATSAEQNRYNRNFPGEAQWVAEFFRAIRGRYPRIKAISWFQWDKEDGNHLLQRVAGQQKEYSRQIQSPRYEDDPGRLVSAPPGGVVRTPREVVPREIRLREVSRPASRAVPRRAAPVRAAAPAAPRRRIRLEIVSRERVPVQR